MDISISRWFLLSLWWRELFLLGSCLGLVSLATTWLLLKPLSGSRYHHEFPRVYRFREAPTFMAHRERCSKR
jgi:hypothetical protein